MNSRLPEDIRVMRATYARDNFDVRKDAKGKEYRYFLYNGDISHLLALLAAENLRDVSITEPTLEEIFLRLEREARA